MWSLTALRTNPHFGRFFDRVHPLCWPILWWQLNRLFRWIYAENPADVLYEVNVWGFITIRYIAHRIDPATYRPPQRTFRPLSDPSWDSAVPACLGLEAPRASNRPRVAAKAVQQALAPNPDTS